MIFNFARETHVSILEKLVNVSFARIRDFRGITTKLLMAGAIYFGQGKHPFRKLRPVKLKNAWFTNYY